MDDPLAALWKQALDGDKQAFEELHAKMIPRLRGLLRARGGSDSDLEDLAQETWLRAIRASQTFDPDKGDFIRWMFRIAVNVLLNAHRTKRRKPPPNPLPDEGIAGTSPIPEDCLFVLERNEQLYGCLKQLESLSRTIISLRFWEGLEFRAIEEKLQITATTIKNAYWRGVRKLLKCMGLPKNEKK